MAGMIHEVLIKRKVYAEPDADGRKSSKIIKVAKVQGRMASVGAVELRLQAQLASEVAAVFVCPVGTDVRDHDRIETIGECAGLEGVWEIAAIKPNISRLRCLLRKKPFGPEDEDDG